MKMGVVTLARIERLKQIITLKYGRKNGETFVAFTLFAQSYNLKWTFCFHYIVVYYIKHLLNKQNNVKVVKKKAGASF